MPKKARLPDLKQFQTKPYDTGRVDLSASGHFLPVPNLISHQVNSFRWFVEVGLAEVFREVSPIEEEITYNRPNKNGGAKQERLSVRLEFSKPEFMAPSLTALQARLDDLTYEVPLKVEAKLTIGKRTREQPVWLGYYPWMTDRGTFIINGNERLVVSQISRSPGVLFFSNGFGPDGRPIYGAKISPYRGTWLEIATLKDGSMSAKVDKFRRVSLASFLVALGQSPARVSKYLAEVNDGSFDFWQATLERDPNYRDNWDSYQTEATIDVYRRIRPGDVVNPKNAREVLQNRFFSARQYDLGPPGRHKLNQRLGLKVPNTAAGRTLRLSDILATVAEVIRLNNSGEPEDDVDSLNSRRVRSVGELVRGHFRVGCVRMERNIRERMRICDPDTVTPSQLINGRPISANIRTFFASSKLSNTVSQTNCLAELSETRRLTSGGPGGLSRDRAGHQVRDIHQTHYGRICPIETPEGGQVGLVLNMTLYAQVDDYGFLQTPYRPVIQSRPADQLAGEIARDDIRDRTGQLVVAGGDKISPQQSRRLATSEGSAGQRQYQVKPRVSDQIVYLNTDAERQACILSSTVSFDDQGYFLSDYGPGRRRTVAEQCNIYEASHVDVSHQQTIGISVSLTPFVEKNYGVRALTAASQARQAVPLVIPQAPVIGSGFEEIVARNTGQVIYAKADGRVVSATGAKLTIKYDGDRSQTHYYPLRYIKNNSDTVINQRLTLATGDKVKAGQVIIEGASVKNGELALGRDLFTAFMFFDGENFEDAVIISERLVKEDILTSITVINEKVEVRETKLGPETVTRDIPNVSEHSLRNLDDGGIVRVGAEVKAGDILVGKITPRGEQELSSEERLLRAIFGEKAKDVRDTSLRLPKGKNGKVIGVRIFSRDQGHELKAEVIEQIQVYVAHSRKIQVGDKLANRHGNKGVIARILPEEDMPYTKDGRAVDVIINPIGPTSRMNLGQLFEIHLGQAAWALGKKFASRPFQGVKTDKVVELLTKTGFSADGKQQLYDGRTGEPFAERTTVGPMYFYKLVHMAYDKIHARSIGPYAIVTQQPLDGKAKDGGLRCGEMEVWGLEAYGAANILQEILTIKSDDLIGRNKAYGEIVSQQEISAPRVPESFNVLIKKLQGLGLKIDLIDSRSQRAVDGDDLLKDASSDPTSPTIGPRPAAVKSETDPARPDSESLNPKKT